MSAAMNGDGKRQNSWFLNMKGQTRRSILPLVLAAVIAARITW